MIFKMTITFFSANTLLGFGSIINNIAVASAKFIDVCVEFAIGLALPMKLITSSPSAYSVPNVYLRLNMNQSL